MRKLCIFLPVLVAVTSAYAQGVGADSLRLRSTAGGAAWLLLPQTATSQYRLLLPPTLGTASNQLMWVNGATGQISLLPPGSVGQILQLGAGGLSWVDLSPLVAQNAWSLVGNSGTNPGVNFLGTTDNQPLVIRTNNSERLRITSGGNVGIGTTTPGATLDVSGTLNVSGNTSIGGSVVAVPNIPSSSTGTEVVVWNANNLERRSASGLVSANAWSLVGNSGTNPGTNFLGTTDAQPLILRTNTTGYPTGGYLRLSADGRGRLEFLNAGASVLIGEGAGAGTDFSAPRYSVMVGYNAGAAQTTGQFNTGIGAAALLSLTTGSDNTAVGMAALYSTTVGERNTAVGRSALEGNQTGAANTAVGYRALEGNVGGSYNTALGAGATVGASNLTNATAIGSWARVDVSNALVLGSVAGVNGAPATVNVGIGTTSPTNRLHVVASSNPLRLEGLQTDNTLTQVLVADATGVVKVRSASTLVSGTAWSLTGNSGTNPGTNFLGTTDAQPLVVRTSNTERLRVDAGGNVGIGTTSPGAKLSLGTDQANTKLAIYDGGSDQYGFGIQGSQFRIHLGNSGARFSFLNAPAGTEVMTVYGSGNVGIGITSPTSRLHVGGDIRSEGHIVVSNTDNTARELRLYEPSGSGAEYTAFRAQPQGANITYTLPASLTPVTTVQAGLLQTDASGNLSWVSPSAAVTTYAWSLTGNAATNPSTNFLGTTDAQPLALRTNNSERMRITSSGNVGIGTTAPESLLDVAGGVAIGTYAGSTPAPSNGAIVSGNVGIGTSSPLSRLDVNGGVAVGAYAGSTAAPTNGLIVSGNTGIGIATPQSRLHLDGGTSTATYLKVTNGSTTGTGSNDGFNIGVSSSGAAELRQYENNSLSLFTSNTEYMRMLSTGEIRLFGLAGTSGGKYLAIENNNGVASQLRLEVPDNSTNLGSYTAFQAGNHSGRNYIYIFPIDTPNVGDVLKVISVSTSGSNINVALAWDTTQGTALSPVNRAVGTGYAPYITYWVNDSTIGPADYAYWDATNKHLGLGNFTSAVQPQYMLHLRGSSAAGSGDLFIQKDGGTGARLYFGTPNLDSRWTAFRAGSQSVNLDYTLPTSGPTNSGNGTNRFALATDNGNSTSPSLQWTTFWSPSGNAGVTSGFLGTTDNNDLRFRTNNSQRMVITSTGNVGIATASPSATLDVNGTANIASNTTIGGNLSANGTAIAFPNIPSNSSATEVVVWNNNNLERRAVAGLVSSVGWSLTGNSGTNPATNFLGTTDAQPLVVRTNNQERLRITGAGALGIGTTSPSGLFNLEGNGTSTELFRISNDLNSTKDSVMVFTSAGRLGVGTTSPTTALHVAATSNPLRLQGLQSDTSSTVLVVDTAGVVKKRSLASIMGAPTYVRKTSDQSVTSSTTYQNDNALVYTASANQIFEIEAYMFISGGSGGIKIRVSIPSGASMKLYAELKKDDQHYWVYRKLTSSSDEISWDQIDNTWGYARIRGIITMGSSGGNVQVQWAQNSSNATATTVEAGSYLKITPVQ